VAVRRTAGWGFCRPQRRIDCLQNSIQILIDVVVPEPQHAKSIAREVAIASLILRRMLIEIVLAAVRFDDELVLHAHEVNDIAVPR
jgi:hypothetical protein